MEHELSVTYSLRAPNIKDNKKRCAVCIRMYQSGLNCSVLSCMSNREPRYKFLTLVERLLKTWFKLKVKTQTRKCNFIWKKNLLSSIFTVCCL